MSGLLGDVVKAVVLIAEPFALSLSNSRSVNVVRQPHHERHHFIVL